MDKSCNIIESYTEYLDNKIKYKTDGLYVGEIRVMTFGQVRVMNKYAQYIADGCNNIKALEIGYGLGVFSAAIEKYNIQKHVIVECHPQICENARRRYANNENVVVWMGFWQNYKPIDKFDCIFYDTTVLNEDAIDSLISFLQWSQEHMSDVGKVSFWYCGKEIDSRIIDYFNRNEIRYDVNLYEDKDNNYLIFIVYKKKDVA